MSAPVRLSRGRWWLVVVGCLVACVAMGLWFGRNILLPVPVLDAGESFTDRWGSRFTVVDVQVREVPEDLAAPASTVLVRYEVSVEDFAVRQDLGDHYDPTDLSTVAGFACVFDLVGDRGQHWSANYLASEPGEMTMCDITSRPVVRSQRVVQYYVVPRSEVDHLVGLSGDARHRSTRFPVIR